jgi:hypothetical protein
VTFYDDPADAPKLGRHVAVDFRAAYGDRAFHCGYVVCCGKPMAAIF